MGDSHVRRMADFRWKVDEKLIRGEVEVNFYTEEEQD